MIIRWVATLHIPSGSALYCVHYVLQTKCMFISCNSMKQSEQCVCQQDEHAGAWAMLTQQWATMRRLCTLRANIWKYQKRFVHAVFWFIMWDFCCGLRLVW
jgi:hypothetical protein